MHTLLQNLVNQVAQTLQQYRPIQLNNTRQPPLADSVLGALERALPSMPAEQNMAPNNREAVQTGANAVKVVRGTGARQNRFFWI